MDTYTALSRRVKHLELDKISQALEITKLKRRVKKPERRNKGRMIADMDADADVVLEEVKEGRTAKSQAEIYKIDLDHDNKVLSMQEDESEPTKVQEVVDVVTTTKIITEVVTATSENITAASITITAAEAQVPAATLTAAPSRVTAAPSRRRKGVVIRDLKESTTTTSTIIPAETKSKDKGKGILVEELKPLKKQQQIEQDEKYARELETEAQARKNIMVYLKNVVGFKMDYFKGMSYDDMHPIFERYFDLNVAFLQKTKEKIKEEESRALKRINETPVEKAAKRQKLDEEVEELKIHLQIVPNEDDDVYTEATPLARKLILLVERKYPLTRFTLDQMMNAVRLEVKEESKVFLELLRLSAAKPRLMMPSQINAAKRNIEYPRALLYGSIAQDKRTTTKRVV
nr:hypothetical protein [Tanacetum cinerariifolium]